MFDGCREVRIWVASLESCVRVPELYPLGSPTDLGPSMKKDRQLPKFNLVRWGHKLT